MKPFRFAWPLLAIPITACGGSAANNSTNAANVAAAEGLEDLNAAIGGDELSPIPEAEDDLAGNRTAPNPAAPPAKGTAPR